MTIIRRPRLGLRREILILLPVSMLVLVLLSTFTLLSYRAALKLLIEERQLEAAKVAHRAAEVVSTATSVSSATL